MNIQNFVRSSVTDFPSINWGAVPSGTDTLTLKWGENPYSPPQKIIDAAAASLTALNRYPTLAPTLKEKISSYTQLTEDQICLTNGADKAFRLLAEVFINQNDEVITFYPSYPVIDAAIKLLGGNMTAIPLTDNFQIPLLKTIFKNISPRTKMIYVCNPNNPTGNCVASLTQIEALAELPILVIVDEAYFEFSNWTAVSLMKKYQNLIVLRSFSKTFGLAGLRIGYVLANTTIIEYLEKVEQTLELFNTSTPSLSAAIAALENQKLFASPREKIAKTRKKLITELQKIGCIPFPSQTSFLLFDIRSFCMTSSQFVQRLQEQNVILKDCSIYQGLDQWKVYTAIPAEKDLPRLLAAIKNVTMQQA